MVRAIQVNAFRTRKKLGAFFRTAFRWLGAFFRRELRVFIECSGLRNGVQQSENVKLQWSRTEGRPMKGLTRLETTDLTRQISSVRDVTATAEQRQVLWLIREPVSRKSRHSHHRYRWTAEEDYNYQIIAITSQIIATCGKERWES